MYQLKNQKQINETAFKDFTRKALLMEYEVVIDSLINANETLKEEFRNEIIDTRIYIGLPDELTTPEFLNNLYANLNLTGEESAYKMHQEMKKYETHLYIDNNISIYLQQSTSENTKEFIESCGKYPWSCKTSKNFMGLFSITIMHL